MSLFWSDYGDCWEPEGGGRREWRYLLPGDLVVFERKVQRVREVRPVPVIDWDEDDREAYKTWNRDKAGEEDWRFRPVYLLVVPVRGGKSRHLKVRPSAGLHRGAYVLHPHYPVCVDCGEPWPCPEIGINREVKEQSAEVERLSRVMPGCCWNCGKPVTSRQKSIAFEGENLLLPGAPSVVFHMRGGSPYCSSAAVSYEKKWVAADPGRHPRLYCPGRLIVHVDAPECTEDPFCPGTGVNHAGFWNHRASAAYVRGCLRCMDACAVQGITVPEASE
jgi:hypothetical protein